MACPPSLLNADDEIVEDDFMLDCALDAAQSSLDFKEATALKRGECFVADEIFDRDWDRFISGSNVLLSSAAPTSPRCMTDFLDAPSSLKVVGNYSGGNLNVEKLLDSLQQDAHQPVLRTLDSTTPEDADSVSGGDRYFKAPCTPTKEVRVPKYISPPRIYYTVTPKTPRKCVKVSKKHRNRREHLKKVRKRLVFDEEKPKVCATEPRVLKIKLGAYIVKGKVELDLNDDDEEGLLGYIVISILNLIVTAIGTDGLERTFKYDCEDDTEAIVKVFLPASL